MDRIIGVVTTIFITIFGNKLYQNHVKKKVHIIETSAANAEEAKTLAIQKGGKSWFGVFVAIVLVIFYAFISSVLFPSNLDHIYSVKDGSFYSYPNKTVGEAFDEYIEVGEWEYVSHDTPYDVVQFTGKVYESDYYTVQVEFILDDTSDSFEINRIIIGGESYTSEEDISLFLHEIFY